MSHTANTLFVSATSSEFKSYRRALVEYLQRPGLRVEEQSGFIRNGQPILTELNGYIRNCDSVIHLVGLRTGNASDDGIPGDENRRALLAEMPDLPERLKSSGMN